MLQLWSIWSPVPTLSFKLHGASFTDGCQLALSSVTHQPHGQNNSECCSIKKTLHTPGSIGPSPVTFLLDSGPAVSVIRLDTLDTHIRNQITDAGLTAPIGVNGSPLELMVPHWM